MTPQDNMTMRRAALGPESTELVSSTPSMSEFTIMADLCDRFVDSGVRYCSIPNVEYLVSIEGRTAAFGLLVDEICMTQTVRILESLGFRRFETGTRDRGRDYLGFDPVSCKLVRLSVEFTSNLTDSTLLGTLKYHHRYRTFLCESSCELLASWLAPPFLSSRHSATQPRWSGTTDYTAWLFKHADRGRLADVFEKLTDKHAGRRLDTILAKEPAWPQYRSFQKELYRFRCRLPKDLLLSVAQLVQRVLVTCPGKAAHLQHGSIIALIGADGAGKSTVLNAIGSWLGGHVAVESIYFGSGDGPVSLPRRLVRFVSGFGGQLAVLRKRCIRVLCRNKDSAKPTVANESHTWFVKTIRLLTILCLARERRRNLKRAIAAKRRGTTVICDRYPQTQMLDMMDSPSLSRWLDHRFLVLRRLADWEFSAYQAAEVSPPDAVIKLYVSPETAIGRKPDGMIARVRRKTEIVHGLEFPKQTRVLEIDAEQGLPEVLARVKAAVWSRIQQSA